MARASTSYRNKYDEWVHGKSDVAALDIDYINYRHFLPRYNVWK